MTKKESLDRFHRLLTLGHYSESSHRLYHLWASRFLDYIEPEDVNDLTLFDAQDFLLYIDEEKGYSDRTFNTVVDVLRKFFAQILDKQISSKQLSKRRIETIQKNPITPDQARQLLDQCSDLRLKAAIALAFGCGLRVSEIVNLKFQDIHKDIQKLTIRNSKGNKTRTVSYPPSIISILNDYCISKNLIHPDPNQYVFPNEKRSGTHLNTSTICTSFVQYIQTFSFHLPDQTFHALRHAYATSLAENNIPLVTIQKLMGHASIATTAVYIHVPPVHNTKLSDPITGDFYEANI